MARSAFGGSDWGGGASGGRGKGAAKSRRQEYKIDPQEYNPISAYYKEGRASVEKALNTLDTDELKAVIKRRKMDGTGKTRKWKTKDKLVNFILDMSESRALQGDVFRNYKR